MENDDFFSIADQFGVMTMPGWCCCDAWQNWGIWQQEQFFIAAESLRSQLKRLRIHPSLLVFLISSDELPPEDVESTYLQVLEEEPWPAGVLSAASAADSNLTGPTGVKMTGPYSWVPPVYWLLDTNQFGGAWGFLTEGGPGENPLTLESLEVTIPSPDYWPIDNEWSYHCGNPDGLFYNLRYFVPPLNIRYGNATSVQDFSLKSQVAAYEGHRAMFEGYSRNKYTSTGVIQWMLNNAWPQMIWHLYDFYLNQGGAYFATKKACEPYHIMYSYNDRSVWVVNSLYQPVSNLVAKAGIYTIPDNTQVLAQSTPVPTLDGDGTMQLFTIPDLDGLLSVTYFLRLQLLQDDNVVSDNVYWLSTQQDILVWNETNFFRTPCSQYSNMTGLQQLPPVDLSVKSMSGVSNTNVTIYNPADVVAFFVRVRLVDDNNNDILPILWEDNYFSIWPGETRTVSAYYNEVSAEPTTIVEVWNNISGGQ